MTGPRALVVVFPGSNGDRDLLEALERAGFDAGLHPAGQALPAGVRLAGLPGGFSYGDYWRAGILASQAPAVRSLPALVAGGGLVIGICNGFQILVEAGLLPGALATNAPVGFRHGWLELEVQHGVASPWFTGVAPGTRLRMPMAHGEGRYVAGPEGAAAGGPRVPLRYLENPNGSHADAASLLDPTGRILGVMPHPERASDPVLGSEDGLQLFVAARKYLEANS